MGLPPPSSRPGRPFDEDQGGGTGILVVDGDGVANVTDCAPSTNVSSTPVIVNVAESWSLGIVTLVRPVQPENAEFPMLVTLLGIVTLVRPVQPLNAETPMLVTLLGIVTLVRLAQP